MSPVELAIACLAGCERILVFTGAGISTESGIPDFRGPHGVWKRVDPAEFTLDNWVQNPRFRVGAWERRFTSQFAFEPNDAHRAVAAMWDGGRMIGCVTQNIDGLHQAAGLPDRAVAEVHGNRHGIVCYERRHPADVEDVAARWRAGDADPRCRRCGSILKATTVLFGEGLPPHAVERSQRWADEADGVLAVGSTLSVYPAANFPLEVASRGEPFVIVNMGRTDHDRVATVKVEDRAGRVLPRLVAGLTT